MSHLEIYSRLTMVRHYDPTLTPKELGTMIERLHDLAPHTMDEARVMQYFHNANAPTNSVLARGLRDLGVQTSTIADVLNIASSTVSCAFRSKKEPKFVHRLIHAIEAHIQELKNSYNPPSEIYT